MLPFEHFPYSFKYAMTNGTFSKKIPLLGHYFAFENMCDRYTYVYTVHIKRYIVYIHKNLHLPFH